ncbi:MAG: glycosyltransferase family 4 protein [Paludibacteraceae bacterium]|nr:glycosyltransferase family 4 protein [Paludibacteraceae bacterium]OPZ01339.1 MAG: Glycogen synthase [Bacteroidetes bacterium ADurb.BinA395]MBP8966762.1 glycosyltransferase family 4 protein [Paludibacteraceae bacterium]HOF98308.1 glycosyltransferase family 4 protein [Paludibacteraceae bacterium]HOL28977.1 glycosyltransferase family 4 protein [Paludibacteraceae bacterium]
MKVLMFGWEFPPHILGGLGTASYGLVKAMAHQPDMEITFVIPKLYGDEDQSFLKIIGACYVPVVWKENDWNYVNERIGWIMNPDEYFWLRNGIKYDFRRIYTNDLGCIEFSGRYPDNLLEEISNYEAVASVLAHQLSFDVIHSHDWLTYPAGIFAKQISGKPLVVHVHATEFDRSRGNVNPIVYDIEKRGMDAANHIITVSNLTRNIVIEKYFQDPKKVTTVHNAVEPLPDVDSYVKTPRSDKIVTFLGRITMQKGPEYFVEAANRVLKKNKKVRFVMAGNGDMMQDMINLAAKRGITDRFHFTGFLKGRQVYQMLADSDVYIMPSVSEPFGISPLEAMQVGTPTIISKQSGCSEILTHSIKIDYWDIDGMADAVNAIIRNPAMYKSLHELGREEVNNIRWEDAGKKVIKIYNSLLGK